MLTSSLCYLLVIPADIQSEYPDAQLAAHDNPQPELPVHQSAIFADNLSDVQLSVSCSVLQAVPCPCAAAVPISRACCAEAMPNPCSFQAAAVLSPCAAAVMW